MAVSRTVNPHTCILAMLLNLHKRQKKCPLSVHKSWRFPESFHKTFSYTVNDLICHRPASFSTYGCQKHQRWSGITLLIHVSDAGLLFLAKAMLHVHIKNANKTKSCQTPVDKQPHARGIHIAVNGFAIQCLGLRDTCCCDLPSLLIGG